MTVSVPINRKASVTASMYFSIQSSQSSENPFEVSVP